MGAAAERARHAACQPALSDVIPSTDVENNWKQVNNTLGAICIGASAPVGQYVALYPNALQYGQWGSIACPSAPPVSLLLKPS